MQLLLLVDAAAAAAAASAATWSVFSQFSSVQFREREAKRELLSLFDFFFYVSRYSRVRRVVFASFQLCLSDKISFFFNIASFISYFSSLLAGFASTTAAVPSSLALARVRRPRPAAPSRPVCVCSDSVACRRRRLDVAGWR